MPEETGIRPRSATRSTQREAAAPGGGPALGTPATSRSVGSPETARRTHGPAYLLIADTIAEQVAAGVYRAGDQLPTEAQLRAQFGVSPVTVRRAINILLDRGLVTTTQGKGTFVRALDLGEATFRLQDITGLWTDDASVDVLLLEARIIPADQLVAGMLQLSPGDPIVYMRRLVKRKDMTLIYQHEYVVYDERRPLVEAQLKMTSLQGLFSSAQGEGMPSGRLTIHACSVEDEAAALLGVTEGAPAFCLESLFHDFEGRPVSWGRFLCRADQFRLTTHIGVAPSRQEVLPL